jgi:hypothetical protein
MATQQQTVLRVQTNIPGAISGSTTYEFLDLYGDIPIKINKSFAELQDISKRNSDYSIGLTLPGSKKNNRFFENFFNVDAQSLYFDATQRVPCNVLLNDESYFTGYMKLNKTSVKDSAVEYDVTLFSNIGDLFGKIGNNLLKDLDYDTDVIGYDYKFNHRFSKFQVSSWDDYNPYELDYEPLFFYPVVHNGYNYSGETVLLSGTTSAEIISGVTRLYTTTIAGSYASNAAAYAAGVKRYRINSPEDGLLNNQLKPALSIRGLITLMFQTYGYTIKSDFFNTPWFRMLYMYGYFSSEATKFSYKVPPKSDAVSNDLAVKLTETFVDDTDPICSNIRTTRTYTIELVYRDNGVATTSDVPLDVVLLFKYYPCGSTTGYDQNVTVTIPANATGTTYTWISNQFVRCPSTCKLEYRQNFGVNNSLSNVPEYTDFPPNTIVIYKDGDQVEFDLVIDWNIKQIDILSSIAKKFNLVFVPDPNVPNQIIIEPYNYYIGTGDIHDWTPKISFDKGFTVEPALNYIESELNLTDLEDGDFGNKSFKDRNNKIYGENKVYNPTAFKSQIKKIDTVFSPELVRQWDTIDTAPNAAVKLPLGINYASNSSSQNSGGSEKIVWTYPGVKTKPKLMYWTGNFNPFLDQVGEAITYSGNVLTNVFYIAESNGDNPRQLFVAPIVGTTMPVGNPDGNKINNDSICNLFNSELPTDIGVTAFSAYTENDAYSIFYQNRIENLYDPNTRFLSGYFNLNYSDIKNLKPNDLIKINEQYFTWNKIDGFNLTNPELTKVELIQANNNPSVYPTRYFQYYYCDNPSTVFKFKTDMTNPSLSGTSFGWSATYDYNVGLLGGNVSGYTSTMRDFVQTPNDTIPYYIYEVSESSYNTSGIDRSYDTMWTYLSNLNGDLNNFNFPTYAYGSTTIITNVFTDCANFNYYDTTYGISTGSSTYHGNPVSQTPTATPTPTPTPNVAQQVRGSLLMSFDELVSDYGLDSYEVQVNGAVRDLHYTPITNLYSTFLYSGDTVTITLNGDELENRQINVYRVDYTTDASNGNMGITQVGVTGVTGTSVSTLSLTFTVTGIQNDYNFEYRIGSQPVPTPTPTPTVSVTPTPSSPPIPPDPFNNGRYMLTNPWSVKISDGVGRQYFYQSSNYGYNWTEKSFAVGAEGPGFSGSYDGAFSMTYNGEIIVVGPTNADTTPVYDSISYISYDYGNNWEELIGGLPSPATNTLNYLQITSYGNLIMGSYKNSASNFNVYLIKTADFGQTWSSTTIPWSGSTPVILDSGLLMSQDGKYVLLQTSVAPSETNDYPKFSTDSGNTFNNLTGITRTSLYLSAMSLNGSIILINNKISYNSGTTFTTVSGLTSLSYNSILMSDDSKYMVAYSTDSVTTPTNSIIYLSSNSGSTFTNITSSLGIGSNFNMRAFSMSANGRYISIVGVGFAILSRDFGVTFSPLSPTLIPTQDYFGSLINKIEGIPPTPTPTKTPTPTPSITPTLTPTPTQTPVPATLYYRYIASGVSGTPLKRVSNMGFSWGGTSYLRSNTTFGTSANSIDNVGSTFYFGSEPIFNVTRSLCRDSGTTQRLDRWDVNVYVNSILVYQSINDIANPVIPICSSQDNKSKTTTNITINPGDVVIVEFRDITTI